MFSSGKNNSNGLNPVVTRSFKTNDNDYIVDENLNRQDPDGTSFDPGNIRRQNEEFLNCQGSKEEKNNNSSKAEFFCDGVVPELKLCPDTPPSAFEGSCSISPQSSSNATMGLKSALCSGSKNPSASGVTHSHSSSNCTEESFECVGEGIYESNGSEHPSLPYTRDGNDLSLTGSDLLNSSSGANSTSCSSSSAGGGSNFQRRNSWMRTSLRRSPQNSNNGESMGHRRWGSFRNPSGTKRSPAVTSSNALASQLYRTSSFHSSGRSSAGDGEEMYSDGSLEDEVIDLTQKVHHLEEKFTVLAETQNDVDDRYTRAKSENAELSTKLFMLEEQLRDTEMRSDERLREEQKRYKESLTRLEREKQLQLENCEIRIQNMERELAGAKVENERLKGQWEREKEEKSRIADRLMDSEREISLLREANRTLSEQNRQDKESLVMEATRSQQAMLELRKEFESLRRYQMESSPGSRNKLRSQDELPEDYAELKSRLREYEEETKSLKKLNQEMQETNDELSAQLLNHGLEEGRHLLNLNMSNGDMGHSLAAEFEAMSQDENIFGEDLPTVEKLTKALKEQKEVNDQLRRYIDGILLNIVENYPQLLEVKNKSSSGSIFANGGK